jgi:hypothetical protein
MMFNPFKIFKQKKHNREKSILKTVLIYGNTRFNVFDDMTVVELDKSTSVYYKDGSSINITIQ